MTCLNCHAPEVTVTDVDRDGKVTVTCRACRATFILHAHPSRVTEVRALGASLVAHQRHLASTPRQLAVSRLVAKGAVDEVSRQILDLVVPPPFGDGPARPPTPTFPPGSGAATLDQHRLDAARSLMAEMDLADPRAAS